MTKEEFKARVYEAFHTSEHLEQFLECAWQLYLQATPHWISADDELPEDNKFVLTYNGTSINLLMLAGNGNWYDHSVAQHRNITHWMLVETPAKLSSLERIGKNWKEKKGGEE